MSTRAEKALKAQKDKHHSILRELVQEPSNKTCADCLAKGPRWASWNLGIFMCIRCAGIHRNLGVHISKCKSIDLDSWTVEQLENVLKWGNKRAALYYECYLPKDFTRPQGNQAVETFIRNKYEKKLYMKKDGEPEYIEHRLMDKLRGVPTTEKENKTQSRKKEVKPTEDKAADKKTILNIAKKAPEVTGVVEEPAKLQVTQTAKSSSMNDLFSLNDAPAPVAAAAPAQPVQSSVTTDDLLNFGAFSDPVPSTPAVDPTPAPKDAASTNGLESMNTVETSKSTKQSILSLYSTGNTSQQQKMYGVPGGVYMQPQQMQQQQQQQQQQQHMAQVSQNQGNMMFSGFPQQSMPNQMHQMNSQMQQMNLSQSNQQMMSGQPQQNPYMQQGGVSLNQFGSSGPSSFSTPMYTSNSGMMQMNGMQYPQQQQQQQQQKFQQNGGMHSNMATTNSVGNFGMNMSNNGWGNTGAQSNMMGMGAPRQQQPAFNYNMNAGHMMNGGGTSGFTMNNQLWN